MTLAIVAVAYAIIYFIGRSGSQAINRALGRGVILDGRRAGFVLLLLATVAMGFFVSAKASPGASSFVIGQVVGEIAIAPAVFVAALVGASAWLRRRKTG